MVEEALLLAIGKTSTYPEKVSVRTKRYLCPFSRDISVKPTCNWQKPCHLVSGEGDGLRLVHKQKSQVWESFLPGPDWVLFEECESPISGWNRECVGKNFGCAGGRELEV